MNSTFSMSRREFLRTTAVGLAAAGTSPVLAAVSAAGAKEPYPITVFSKAFQELNFEDTADLVAEVGWDGIECPVRKGGQVLPERVEDDLPRFVEALKKRGKRIVFITTDVRNATDPASVKVLRTAARLGIRHYRLAGWTYRAGKPLPAQLDELRPALKDIAALDQELGICAGFQNHSGNPNIGAAVWDIYELIKDLDPRWMAMHFDIGHATVEGGLIWPIHFQLMAERITMVYLKDFVWKKTAKGWTDDWCPLGQGMVSASFFNDLKKTGFAGAVNQHFEYPIGEGKERVKILQKDLQTLRQWLG
jgi:sugar phosphate isomerase/epimerase